MAKLLHIETSTKVCSVAISENGKLIDLLEECSDSYIHAEKLTVFIDTICRQNKWTLSSLDAIVVTSGPGSYTGLRIGVSTAKGLCYALEKPLIAINSIQTIGAIAHQKYPTKTICAMIDARRMEVFSAIYGADGKEIKTLAADIITANSYQEFQPFVAVGDGAVKVEEIWKNKDIVIDSTVLSSAKGQVELGYKKFIRKEFEDVAYFEPKYLKDFVTTKPKKKNF